MNSQQAILDKKQDIKMLCIKHGAKELRLFGSVLRGQDKSDSDIDFVVLFQEGKLNFDNFMDLKLDLENLFSRKVDLVTRTMLHRLMRDKVLSESIDILNS